MKFNWKWVAGIAIGLLVFLPLIWTLWIPFGGYGMMNFYGYSYRNMPMMNFGYGMMPFGTGLMWLTQIGILALIALGIVWLAKQITKKTE